MQISNVNAAFPNTVSPSSPAVVHAGTSVTKDILSSSFSPLSEVSELSSLQNSISETPIVYSPDSLVKVSESSISSRDTSASQLTEQGADQGINSDQSVQPEQDVSPSGVEVSGSAQPNIASEGGSDNGKADQQDFSGFPKAPADSPASSGLTADELAIVQELSSRDQEVRTHEQQHQSVGGQHAGSASFSFQTGPDGVQYAVGGEVSIDISAVSGDPRATIDKMRTVQAAALAPAEPSSQDRSVAAAASRIMLQAQSDLVAQQAEVREAQAQKSEEEQEGRRPSISEGVRTYERLIGLGQQFENGLTPSINLDEVV